MPFSGKRFVLYAGLAVLFFTAGWACDKYTKVPGLSDDQVVATVGGHSITFRDWMRQVDMTRVFITPIDPANADQVKAVLNSLIDQQLVLDAAQKARYSSGEFDDLLKKKLIEADLTLKEVKDRLEKDMQTVARLEKNYKDPYKRLLLAREFAVNRLDKVNVSDREMRDWYAHYSAQAAEAGQKLPDFKKITPRLKNQIKPQVQQEKFIQNLQGDTKIDKNDAVIKKYLDTLSPSQQMLDARDKGLPPVEETIAGKK